MRRNPMDPALWALVLAGIAIWLSLGRLNEQRRLFDLIREVRAESARETALAKEIQNEVPKEVSPLSPQMRNGQLVPCLGTWCVGDEDRSVVCGNRTCWRTATVAGHASEVWSLPFWSNYGQPASERSTTEKLLAQELLTGGWVLVVEYAEWYPSSGVTMRYTNKALIGWCAELNIDDEGVALLRYEEATCGGYLTDEEAAAKVAALSEKEDATE